jgi:hypothetical protein
MYRWKAQSRLRETITGLSDIRVDVRAPQDQNRTVWQFGAGDFVSFVTKSLGISPCASCARRAEKLNAVISISRVRVNGRDSS